MIFSVGFAFAEDINQTDSDLGVTDSDVISEGTVKSYTDLSADLNKDTNVNLAADYIYNETSDNVKQVNIVGSAGKEYVINGNNHVIDGSGKAGALKIDNVAKITINNLTFRNCNQSAIEIWKNTTLILNNVIFTNNRDVSYGGAIYSDDSYLTVNNCNFSENYAKQGAAIWTRYSAVTIYKSEFKNKNSMEWSLIYASAGSSVEINYCNFENLKAKYATALYTINSQAIVSQSKFVNLSASVTGGAIASKSYAKVVSIQNCEFENVRSAKNGGAIFFDVNVDSDSSLRGTLNVNHTKFTNCSSEFGGAILQLGGFLNVIHSNFIKNHAVYDGGAIYTSNATVFIYLDKFDNNYGENSDSLSKGGALYLDYSNDIELDSCNFTNNKASIAGAVYLFDTLFKIQKVYFSKNGEGVHSYFTRLGSTWRYEYDKVNSDTFNFDDTYYPYVVDFQGKQIVLNPIKITGNASQPYFDLRNFNAVTPVKDQGSNGACWAFGATAAIESAFKMATGIDLDISEDNIQNSGLRYSFYGKPSNTEGGKLLGGLAYALSWLGIVNSEYDAYDELGKISQILFTPDSYHLTDAMFVNSNNRTAIKEALLKYGALTIHINGANPNNLYYNSTTHGLYCNNASLGNHFVTIVGWNDTYSRNNFNINPGEDGAWIVKNSWGTGWGDNGYFYLSYADAPYLNAAAIAYIINNTDVYNKLYQYDIPAIDDFLTYTDINTLSYANTYESVGNDLIGAVGTYFYDGGISYTVKVKVNGNLVYSQKGKSSYYGYQTIKLDKTVAINEGDKFSIEIEVDTNRVPYLEDTRLFFQKGNSVVYTSKITEDLSYRGMTTSIKVYTINNTNNVSGVKAYSNNKDNLQIKSKIEGATVTIAKDGKNIASATVKDGKAVFNTTVSSGNYTMITSYEDEEIMSLLEIYPTIILFDNDVKVDEGDLDFTFIFFDDDDDKALNKTNVTLTVDGKEINKTTDENGMVILTKAEIGAMDKDHNITATNPVTGEYVEFDVKILSYSVKAANVEKYYKGSQKLNVAVVDSEGDGVSDRIVFVKIAGETLNATTDDNGVASFDLNMTVGNYTALISVGKINATANVTIKSTAPANSNEPVNGDNGFETKFIDGDGKPLANANVTFIVDGKQINKTTDANGVAKLTKAEIGAEGMQHNITVIDPITGEAVSYTVSLSKPAPSNPSTNTPTKQTIVLKAAKKTIKIKKSAKKFIVKATLKINGKKVKGKVIKFKFKGKTYKAKTNKNGVAKVTIKKKVIKKLKKGKKYTVKITYGKKTAKTVVKVKR